MTTKSVINKKIELKPTFNKGDLVEGKMNELVVLCDGFIDGEYFSGQTVHGNDIGHQSSSWVCSSFVIFHGGVNLYTV